jgi:hypothetical protein
MTAKKTGPQCQCCAHPRRAELDRDLAAHLLRQVVAGVAMHGVVFEAVLASDLRNLVAAHHISIEFRPTRMRAALALRPGLLRCH